MPRMVDQRGDGLVFNFGATMEGEVGKTDVHPGGEEILDAGGFKLGEGVQGEGAETGAVDLDPLRQNSIGKQIVLCCTASAML